jgi:hypothetical protein
MTLSSPAASVLPLKASGIRLSRVRRKKRPHGRVSRRIFPSKVSTAVRPVSQNPSGHPHSPCPTMITPWNVLKYGSARRRAPRKIAKTSSKRRNEWQKTGQRSFRRVAILADDVQNSYPLSVCVRVNVLRSKKATDNETSAQTSCCLQIWCLSLFLSPLTLRAYTTELLSARSVGG